MIFQSRVQRMLYVVFPMSVKSHHKRLPRDPPEWPCYQIKGNGQLSCSIKSRITQCLTLEVLAITAAAASRSDPQLFRISHFAWTIGSVISVMPGMRSTRSTLWIQDIQALLSRRGKLQSHANVPDNFLIMPPISDWKLVSGRFSSKMWC